MVPTPPGKFLKVLESPSLMAWKVLEISVSSGKFLKFDVRVLENS